MTEKIWWNSTVQQIKIMSKKNWVTTKGRREVKVGIILLGNYKNVIKLFFSV